MNTGFVAVLSRINCQRWDYTFFSKKIKADFINSSAKRHYTIRFKDCSQAIGPTGMVAFGEPNKREVADLSEDLSFWLNCFFFK